MPTFFFHFPRNLVISAVLGAALAFLAATPSGAILPGDRTGLELTGGVIKLEDGSWDYSSVDRFAGISLVRELGRGWQWRLSLRNGFVRSGVTAPGQEAGWSTAGEPPFYTLITQPMAGIDYQFAASSRLTPFLGTGIGLTSWKVIRHPDGDPGWFAGGDAVTGYDIDGRSSTLEGTDLTLELSMGVRWRVTERLELNTRAIYQVRQGNDLDDIGLSSIWGPDHVDANRAAGAGFIGLTWWFGNHDADGDGVPDDRDLCPHQAEDRDGFNDLDGCPDPDNDHDGIPDVRDNCPQQAEDLDGYEDQDGCPDLDNDGDGVRDGRDRCPGTPPGTPVDAHGCPLAGGH